MVLTLALSMACLILVLFDSGSNFGPFNGGTNLGPFETGQSRAFEGGQNWGPFNGLGNFGPFKNTNDWYNDTDFGFNFNTKNKVDNKSQAAADGNFSGQGDAYAKGQADAYAKGQAVWLCNRGC